MGGHGGTRAGRPLKGFLILLFLSNGLHAQESGPSDAARETWAMGTRFRVLVQGTTSRQAVLASEEVIRKVEGMERLLSTWDPSTEMSLANRSPAGTRVEVSKSLLSILSEAETWAQRTGRAFEPVVGALVDAWDLRGTGTAPPRQVLDLAMDAVGPGAFRIIQEESEVVRTSPEAWIDPGGFGKGAALRAAARALDSLGVEKALLDLGGQIWAAGHSGNPWVVSVTHPARRSQPLFQLALYDASVATSGTSERWVEVDGRRLGHILDPRTGHPVPAWGSVTVVTRDPFAADVVSTALYVMGPTLGMDWIRDFPEIGVLFLTVCDRGVSATWNRALETWLPRGSEERWRPEMNRCAREDKGKSEVP